MLLTQNLLISYFFILDYSFYGIKLISSLLMGSFIYLEMDTLYWDKERDAFLK